MVEMLAILYYFFALFSFLTPEICNAACFLINEILSLMLCKYDAPKCVGFCRTAELLNNAWN